MNYSKEVLDFLSSTRSKEYLGAYWSFPVDKYTYAKLLTIAEQACRAKSDIILYLLRYAFRTEKERLIWPGAFVIEKNPSTVSSGLYKLVGVRTPPGWIKELRDVAWEYQVKDESYRHTAALLIKLSLSDKITDNWVAFFGANNDVVEAILSAICESKNE